eukprot:8638205-Ditylum_brightwellii.AAC.1
MLKASLVLFKLKLGDDALESLNIPDLQGTKSVWSISCAYVKMIRKWAVEGGAATLSVKKTKARRKKNDSPCKPAVATANDEEMQMVKAAMRAHAEEKPKEIRSTKKLTTSGVDDHTSSRSTVVTTNDEQMQMLKAAMRIHMEEQSKDMRSTAGENENEAKTKSSSSPPLNNGSLNRKPEASSLDAHVKKRAPSSTSVSSCKKRKVSPSKKQCANDKIISCKINGLTRSPSLVEVQQRTATLTSESACKMGSSSKKRSANENASSHMVEELIRSPSPVEAKQRS